MVASMFVSFIWHVWHTLPALRLWVNRSETLLLRRTVLCETRLWANRSATFLLMRTVMRAVGLNRSETFFTEENCNV